MKKILTVMPCFLALIMAASCAGRSGSIPVVVLVVGDARVQAPGKEFTPAKAGQVIKKGDIIKTGPRSCMSIQIGERGIVQIAGNSTLEALSLFEAGACELYLSRGTVLSRIDRLGREHYRVKTPTAVASVRGTVFSVSYGDEESTVGVSRGIVDVVDTASGKKEEVGRGKAAEVRAGIVVRDLYEAESLELEKADAVEYVQDVGTATPEALEEKGKTFITAIEKIDRKIEEVAPRTLEGMRAKYGRIDVVTLYTGKVYRGVILSRGASLTILTPDGTVEVPKEKVKSTVAQ
jgi:hypothetical protein